jgi:Ca-activated chloride channel family protein
VRLAPQSAAQKSALAHIRGRATAARDGAREEIAAILSRAGEPPAALDALVRRLPEDARVSLSSALCPHSRNARNSDSLGRMLSRLLFALVLFALTACKGGERASPGVDAATAAATSGGAASATARVMPPLLLEVVFSSEKKDWADEAIKDFNRSGALTSDGRTITVKVAFTGSVEPIDGIVAGISHPHVFSPASSLILPLLNDQWIGAKGVSSKPIVASSDPLVLSPVVIAMWEPMAKALGWPGKKLGWSDVGQLAKTPEVWKGRGHPEWGDFRFGHTHPGYSNSGLIAVLAEHYAAAGKTRDLEATDVTSAKAKDFVRAIEGAVVHYGRSTGFFYDALASHGPAYLSAAALYENLVVASDAAKLPFPLVCVYPKEGTQWADHPYAVLDAPWVGAPEKEAAAKLKAHLLSRPVQERAMQKYGFRPALTDVALAAPIDVTHGADPKEPQTLLGTPNVRVLRTVLDTWRETKRGVDVVIVFDRSGSMNGARITNAREGLAAFLATLRPTDRVTLLTFNNVADPPSASLPPATLVPKVKEIFADGGTALYDSILRGREIAEASARAYRTRIHAVVVLTDGEDTNSKTPYGALLQRLTPAEQGSAVRIFTIGYGVEASEKVLIGIATRSGGAYYHGDVDNIKQVYDEIASFF